MEEKILIKSEVDNKVKKVIQYLFIGLFTLFAILVLILATVPIEAHYYHSSYYIGSYRVSGYTEYVRVPGFQTIFGKYDANAIGEIFTITALSLACVSLVAGIVLLIVFLAILKCTLEITESNVKGRTFFGKEVVLPLYMISAYSTRKFLSTIAISTASGITKFALIKNYAEIGDVLAQKTNERQERTANQTVASAPASQGNVMDDLKKLKDLLDSGIITQEEFDAKKKQLLGL